MTNPELITAIYELQHQCHQNAVLHGFHEGEFNFGEKIALIHSELSEALETYRKHGLAESDEHCAAYPHVAVELADAVIRILDLVGYLNLNFGPALLDKHEYNKSRPFKHGKNF